MVHDPKQVRILDPSTKKVHTPSESPSSPGLRTPSPTFSDSTASSLTSPPTPQSLFRTTPLPASNSSIHDPITYLEVSPPLHFDLVFPPSCLLPPSSSPSPSAGRDFSSASSPSLKAILLQPATYPVSSSIKLESEFLPWSIKVTAESYVTFFDVLQALYSSLQCRVTPEEWDHSLTHQHTISFYKWTSRAGGKRRIDYLVGRTLFSGISPIEKKPGVFRIGLKFGRPQRSGFNSMVPYIDQPICKP